MATLFTLLGLLSIVLMCIGLIRPTILSTVYRKQISRSKIIVYHSIFLFLSLFLIGLSAPENQNLSENLKQGSSSFEAGVNNSDSSQLVPSEVKDTYNNNVESVTEATSEGGELTYKVYTCH
jgi:ABC-type transport system involved in multi-copper enzyme maturation permease subunit